MKYLSVPVKESRIRKPFASCTNNALQCTIGYKFAALTYFHYTGLLGALSFISKQKYRSFKHKGLIVHNKYRSKNQHCGHPFTHHSASFPLTIQKWLKSKLIFSPLTSSHCEDSSHAWKWYCTDQENSEIKLSVSPYFQLSAVKNDWQNTKKSGNQRFA